MNRQSIRQGAQAELRYAPTSTVSTNDFNALINLEMLSLAAEEDWPFVIQYAEYPLYKDFQATVALTANSSTATPTVAPTAAWVGAFLVDEAGDEWEIAGFENGGADIYLTMPWSPSTPSATQDVWIRYRQYPMPRDCMKVLDQVLFQADNVMVSPIGFVSQTDKATYPWTRNVGGARPAAWFLMPDQTLEEPPTAPVATISAGAALTVQPYRYAYTFLYGHASTTSFPWGRESAPSLVTASVTPTGGSPAVTLSNLAAPGGSSGVEYLSNGVTRLIYREDNGSGIFRLRAVQSPPLAGITTYVDVGTTLSPTVRTRLEQNPTQRYLELRPYPGLDDYSVRMRYYRRIPTLDGENDAPPWDASFHDVLMWRVVVRMLSRPGFEAKDLSYAQQRYQERYAAMRAALLGDRIRAQRRLFRAEGGQAIGGPPGGVPRFTNT